MTEWQSVDSAPEGVEVMTKIDDADGARNEQVMIRKGHLWWINYGTRDAMYVDYRPTHWASLPAPAEPAENATSERRHVTS